MAVTLVSDIIVPEVFNPYMLQMTEEKSRLIASGAVVRDSKIDQELSGGGITFNSPSFRDLENDADNVSSDSGSASTPNNITTQQEIAVRLSRNNSWGSADLAAALAGVDPMNAIASRVAAYWTRRYQQIFVATVKGIFADNAASPTGTDTHTQNDMTHDISGASFVNGVTNFSGEAFIDTAVTMGDSMDSLSMVMVHSIVYARMQKNNLIDFIPDASGQINIPTYLGRMVIIDDGLPATSGVFESWVFGAGALRLGVSSPKVPVEVERDAAAGNGGGTETLYSRTELCLHPAGHAYIGTPAIGGPSNAATSNNLAAAGSWSRVFAERKQIKIARLISREY